MTKEDLKTGRLADIDDDAYNLYFDEANNYVLNWLVVNAPNLIKSTTGTFTDNQSISAIRVLSVKDSLGNNYCNYSLDAGRINFDDTSSEFTVTYVEDNNSILLDDSFAPLYRDYILMLMERECRDDSDQAQIQFHMQWIELYQKQLSNLSRLSSCSEESRITKKLRCNKNFL